MIITEPTAPAATDLLASYRPGSPFFFASPRGTLLTGGVYFGVPRSVRPDGLGDLPDRVAAVLDLARAAGHDEPLVVGAVPFDASAHARLCVPDRVWRAGRLPAGTDRPATAATVPAPGPPYGTPAPPGPAWQPVVQAVPDPYAYVEAVRRAVDRLRDHGLDKVVLARSLHLTGNQPVDPGALLRRLASRDPHGYTYAVDLGAGRTLLGASPELLVSRHGRAVVANPLAGSVPRADDPVEDQRRAEALLRSVKDRHEHAMVVDAVASTLRPLCATLEVPAEPVLASTASMWHLSTTVTGTVADPAVSALALACALHPTPAVCGTPRPAARAAIAEYEAFDRGFYTGMVGWSDASGDGEWVVTIRCAVAEGRSLRLYAGAGVVSGSDPQAELAETSAKFRTLLDGLGL